MFEHPAIAAAGLEAPAIAVVDPPVIGRDPLVSLVRAAYVQDKVQQGVCSAQTADDQPTRLLGWLGDSLEDEPGKLTPKRAAALYE